MLKQIGNPEFTDVTIPDPMEKQQIQNIHAMLEKSVQQMLDNAITSESGNVDRSSQHIRSNTLDETEGLNKNLNTSVISNSSNLRGN